MFTRKRLNITFQYIIRLVSFIHINFVQLYCTLRLRIRIVLNSIRISGKGVYKNWRVDTEEDSGLCELTETKVWSWYWLRKLSRFYDDKKYGVFLYLYFLSSLTAVKM